MKLIFAITERSLAETVLDDLAVRGFPVTLIHAEGGFLAAGQGTLMIGVPDGAADFVIRHLIEQCGTTMQSVDSLIAGADPTEFQIREQSVIVQGGLALFVLTVSRFERMT
ncbi:MAG TPA: cyclic-di-AMP receptor [Thermomicrobiales bacterium]|nr:cyclic-di-AMP receptor [Thermomicrobiales bacterium]HRA48852.1 cyclic-di-AMP receptor [Thermomicrobiales bacterium]